MKILNLTISTPKSEIVRTIEFDLNGISFIYGDIQDPKNLGATINSLGKTLLLKLIDYILGANEDSTVIKKELYGFILEATVIYEEKEYSIKRTLGNSDSIYVEGLPYTLTDYKNYFNIERSFYGKQIILSKKSTEISFRTYPNKNDVMNCLSLLQLNDILEDIDIIYTSQDKITDYKKQKNEMIGFYGDIDIKEIDEEIYFVDKEVKRLTIELEKISNKIKGIEISEIQQDIVNEYADKSKLLKRVKSEYEKKRLECQRLIDFIENSNKIDISSEHILAIFEKTKQEVPVMIRRKLQEVETFHKKVYEERKEFLSDKKGKIEHEMVSLQNQIYELSKNIDRIGAVISVNEVYQESIELYGKYNGDLQELKYKEGKLSQIKNIDDNMEIEDKSLVESFKKADQIRKSYDELVQTYRDFIYNITKLIYDDDVNSYFDIKIRKKHLKTRPVVFEFSLKGDTGEGVSEVKKNLMDYLLCRYNTYLNLMIQDILIFLIIL